MTASGRPRRLIVVGRDAPLWLAAATLARALGPAGIAVEAVELPTRLSSADMIVTQPALEALHHRIGVDEERLLRATGGGFSLGQNFVGRRDDDVPFFHAWGSYGAAIDGLLFIGHWLRARRAGLTAAFQDFSLAAVAAKNGRMLLPDEETQAFGRVDYGYHLPALAYAAYLKRAARASGVRLIETRSVDVVARPDGGVAALRLDDGRTLAADLFVDATGAEGRLAAGTTGSVAESWHGFPGDRCLIGTAPPLVRIPPYAEMRAGEAGWTALHPSLAATGVIHVFHSGERSDAAALHDAEMASGQRLRVLRVEPLKPGFRQPWTANRVALGAAACSLDPVHGAELHLVQLGLVHLLALFPAGETDDAECGEYNRVIRSHAERIRDFQQAYYVTSREPGGFWDRARSLPPTSALTHRLATFAVRGIVAPMEDDTFPDESWQALLLGQGVIPASWPPPIDTTSAERLRSELRRLLAFVATKVESQPTHDGYLRRLVRNEAVA